MSREKKKQEKRAAILKAARTEFDGRRFDEVKLDEIAARAGVGKGTLYLYFKNKDDLFLQLAVDGMDEMAARVNEVSAWTHPYEECFFLLGKELVEFFCTRVAMVRMMHQAGSEQVVVEFMKRRERMKAAVRGFLERGVKEHALRDDVSVAELHTVLVGPLLLRGRFVDEGQAVASPAVLKIIWDGIAKR